MLCHGKGQLLEGATSYLYQILRASAVVIKHLLYVKRENFLISYHTWYRGPYFIRNTGISPLPGFCLYPIPRCETSSLAQTCAHMASKGRNKIYKPTVIRVCGTHSGQACKWPRVKNEALAWIYCSPKPWSLIPKISLIFSFYLLRGPPEVSLSESTVWN